MKIFIPTLLVITVTIVHDVDSLIKEAPLPRQLRECYERYSTTPLSKVVGKTLCWYCESPLRMQIKGKVEPLKQTQRNYLDSLGNSLIEEMHHRIKRQAGGGPPQQRCIRKEYRMLTRREREDYHRAVNLLKEDTSLEPNMYDAIAMAHVGDAALRAHGGPGFLGWHRIYLMMYERSLQRKVPGVCLPYVDNTIEAELGEDGSYLFSEEFLGNANGVVTTGPFANWTTPIGQLTRNVGNQAFPMDKDILNHILSQTRIEDIVSPMADAESDLEFHHGSYHIHVGGLMESIDSASFEPLFFMHHAYIDYVWELFRQRLADNGGDPEFYPETADVPPLHTANTQVRLINNVTHRIAYFRNVTNYDYDPSPVCSRQVPHCGSRYLACNTTSYRCYPIDPNNPPFNPGQGGGQGNPNTGNPGTGNPGTGNPNTGNPGTGNPGTGNPNTGNPWTGNPNTGNPWTGNPGTGNPGTGNPNTGNPWPGSSGTGNPGTGNPNPGPSSPPPSTCSNSQKYVKAPRGCQNTFCIDGVCDTNQWVYFPVKVISNRAPEFSDAGSFPVRNGRVETRNDIYEPRAYTAVNQFVQPRAVDPKGYGNCKDTHGIGQIFISSQGINYDGYYSESSIIDQRLATSISIAYMAVKDVGQSGKVTALLRAFDQCGRICHTACRIPGSSPARYRPCSGVVDITPDFPKQYSSTYGESLLDVWGYRKDRNCPVFDGEDFFMSFYCDYKDRIPWVDPKPYVPAPLKKPMGNPSPVLSNIPIVPVEPTKPRNVCKLSSSCTVNMACMDNKCSQPFKRYACEDNCTKYALCVYGKLWERTCHRDSGFDPSRNRCVPRYCSSFSSNRSPMPMFPF